MHTLAAKRASPVPLRWMRTMSGKCGSAWFSCWLSSERALTLRGFDGCAIDATAVGGFDAAGTARDAAPSTGLGALGGGAAAAVGFTTRAAAGTGAAAF